MAQKEVDRFNLPILLAREMAFRQVQAFLQSLPNPPGQMPRANLPKHVSIQDLKRLARGE